MGIGYDVHQLVADRRLVLGGVEIPFTKGLLGHSDADVLVHALCDALLGAAGLGDIGMHYPDTDSEYKGIYSIDLLKRTCTLLDEHAFSIVNVDTVVFAEQPKLGPYRQAMRERMALAMNVPLTAVNIKATTTEGLGMIGKGEGISALCIAAIMPKGPMEQI